MSKPELLAPAGSLLSVYSAVNAGADAVYLGVGDWNARARAENLSLKELEKAIHYCYPRGVRVYLTMNILLKDEELTAATELISSAYTLGIHAVIIQDIGLLARVRTFFPLLPVHASTQMNLYRPDIFSYVREAGISRIILPRELTIDQIKKRAEDGEKAGIETEVFVHGALCNSFSGLCLFSSMNGSLERSGNRGRCAQPCREEYSLTGKEGEILHAGRLFSLRDQSAYPLMAELMNSKVRSLKIEGRMKDPDYVSTVVSVYRNLIEVISSGNECSAEEAERANTALLLAYNRGGAFTTGYMSPDRSTLAAGEFPGKYGIRIGNIRNVNPLKGIIEIYPCDSVVPKPKDIVSIRENNREKESFPIGKISIGKECFSLKGLHPEALLRLKPGMDVFLTKAGDPAAMTRDIQREYRTPVIFRIEKSLEFVGCIKVIAYIEDLFGQSVRVEKDFDLPLDYSGHPLENQRIIEQLSRCKDTPFFVLRVDIGNDLNLHTPVSFINSIRREMLNRLESETLSLCSSRVSRCQQDLPEGNLADPIESSQNVENFTRFSDWSQTRNDRSKTENAKIAIEYISLRHNPDPIHEDTDYHIFSVYDVANPQCIERIERVFHNRSAQVYIRIPGAYTELQAEWIDHTVRSFSKRNSGIFRGIITADRFHQDLPFILSHQSNLYNKDAVIEAQRTHPLGFFLSEEITDEDVVRIISETNKTISDSELFIIRYGPIEWMQSMTCPLGRNGRRCTACKSDSITKLDKLYKKRKKEDLMNCLVLSHPEFCVSEIFGSRKFERSEKMVHLLKSMNIAIIHTVRIISETAEQTNRIISSVRNEKALEV